MAETMSVRNPRTGQVAHFTIDGPHDPRAVILQERIRRGALESASGSAKSGDAAVTVVEIDAGVRDENGNLLKSVHGGGLDPDAAGDARGVPSGSGLSAAQAKKDAQVAAGEVAKQAAAAAEAGVNFSETAQAAAAAAVGADGSEKPAAKK